MNSQKWSIAVFILLLPACLFCGIYPQAGMELYMGSNAYLSLSPWAALRVNISANSSIIFKFYRHILSYDYLAETETTNTLDAQLSNFTLIYYYQKDKIDYYAAASYLTGPAHGQTYSGAVLDSGLEYKISKTLSLTAGIYLLHENSAVWFPADAQRNILSFSLKGGVKFKLIPQLILNPNVYILNNSDGVTSLSYALGLVYMPRDPVYISIYYWRYSEKSAYKFAGNYISAGLNFYF